MYASACFVSDIHLRREAEPKLPLLLELFQQQGESVEAIYILGDLFDYWVGDDDPATLFTPLFECFRQLRAAGVALYFLPGNRDFLFGLQQAERWGLVLIEEYERSQVAGFELCLMHGDLLCTDDLAYSHFRQQVRTPQWQAEFLQQPLEKRQQIAQDLRQQSREQTAQKQAAIMDVNPQAVIECFSQQHCDWLIHGHTHRPAVYPASKNLKGGRVVLGDWSATTISYCRVDANGIQLVDPRIPITQQRPFTSAEF